MAVYLCPKCKQSTAVLDVRNYGDGRVYRRRRCKPCEYRFTTCEVFIGDRSPGYHRRYPMPGITPADPVVVKPL